VAQASFFLTRKRGRLWCCFGFVAQDLATCDRGAAFSL
jgi:hypothetical protein